MAAYPPIYTTRRMDRIISYPIPQDCLSMKIVSDQKKINRYSKIGMYTSLASLAFLFAAIALAFTSTSRADLTNYSFLAMVVGLILSQVGVYFANRWGKSPRVDERISQGLKGLDDRYVLYHYTAPVPHLLTGPSGIWVITPQYQGGTITYEKNRYKQQGVGFLSRIIGQEGVARPDMEAKSYQEDMQKFLKKSMTDEKMPEIYPVIVFTSPKASVQASEAPVPTLHVDKLKDFVRRKAKEVPANMNTMQQVQDLLPDDGEFSE